MSGFARVVHRARDVAAARGFYTAVLGAHAIDMEIVPLPEAAAARGAPAHWLGAIGVDDVARVRDQLVARAAQPLGPIQQDARGAFASLRDAGGAAIALCSPSSTAPRPPIVWSHLDAHAAEATFATYSALFGWQRTEAIDLGAAGVVQQFAWQAGGPSVGSYADLATRPHHPMWIFHFRVASLDAAANAVRTHGGVVLAEVTTPDKARVLVCDDPHAGGFALRAEDRG